MKFATGIELFNEDPAREFLFTGGGWIEAGVEVIRFHKFNLRGFRVAETEECHP